MSPSEFYEHEEKFKKQKEAWIDAKQKNHIDNLKRMASQPKMSKKSQAIWENSSKGGKSVYSGSYVTISPRSRSNTITNSEGHCSPERQLANMQPNRYGSKVSSKQSQVSKFSSSQQSVNNFLNRNFETIHEQREDVMR